MFAALDILAGLETASGRPKTPLGADGSLSAHSELTRTRFGHDQRRGPPSNSLVRRPRLVTMTEIWTMLAMGEESGPRVIIRRQCLDEQARARSQREKHGIR